MGNRLQTLYDPRAKLSLLLNAGKQIIGISFGVQGPHQYVCSGYRVLNRQIDTNAKDGRHGMSRISDAQEAGTMPAREPVDLHRQQLDFLPILQLCHAAAKKRCNPRDILSERFETLPLELLEGILWNDETRLKVVVPVDQDQHFSKIDMSQHLLAILSLAADAEPKHVDRNAQFPHLQFPGGSHKGMTPVACNNEVGSDLLLSCGCLDEHAAHSLALVEEIDCFMLHAQIKIPIFLTLLGQEV